MRGYQPGGAVRRRRRGSCPSSPRSRPRATGGWARTRTPTAACCCKDLELPDFRDYAVAGRPARLRRCTSATTVLGDVAARRDGREPRPVPAVRAGRDRVQPPAGRVRDDGPRPGRSRSSPTDDHLAPDGRVMEVLSEHLLQGWLEGYLLTGRHGLFTSYEAFAHIVDSMVNQHAKWLHDINRIPWRRPIREPELPDHLHVWRQDHNGSSHQDPGFIDHVVNKKAEIARVYLPPDANCLLSVADHVLRSRQYINVIVAGKQPQLDYLTMDEAVAHCTRGLGIWELGVDHRRRAGRRAGRRRRDPDDGDARGRRPAAAAPARPEGAGRERRRPDAPAVDRGAPARAAGPRVRRGLHRRTSR